MDNLFIQSQSRLHRQSPLHQPRQARDALQRQMCFDAENKSRRRERKERNASKIERATAGHVLLG